MGMVRLGKMGLRVSVLLAALAIGLAGFGAERTEAGLYDRVKDIFELPGEVDKLKEEYGRVKDSYDSALMELDNARRTQEKLLEENARLAEQNRLLAEAVQQLKESEQDRSRRADRLQRMIWTAVLLVGGYFAVTRVARYVMRARSR